MSAHWSGSARCASGFTLIEMIVALVLTVLLFQLLMPLLAQSTAPDDAFVPEMATWQSVLRSDLANLVSPAKSGVAVVMIRSRSADNAFGAIELQSFLRPGSSSRGPVKVTYILELVDGDLALVRYGQGWHDGSRWRHVLMTGLRDWEIRVQSARSARTGALSASADRSGGVMEVVLYRGNQLLEQAFSVPYEIKYE